jgi:hypothetical protein
MHQGKDLEKELGTEEQSWIASMFSSSHSKAEVKDKHLSTAKSEKKRQSDFLKEKVKGARLQF